MTDFGYMGQILEINLTDQRINRLDTPDYTDRFIGGRGLGAKIYWDKVSPGITALDQENHLIFATGPVAGFPRLSGSRCLVCGKSPALEPETFAYGNLGGSWGSRLKFAGYDALVIHGKADEPVYVFLHDGKAEIRDATSLWGKTTTETQQILKADLGEDVRVLTTGPAGENLVSFASIVADEGSTAGGGFGSVMGAKKLKAVVVRGDKRPSAANPARVKEIADRLNILRKGIWDIFGSMIAGKSKRQVCYGCFPSGCFRSMYTADDGSRSKFFCQARDAYKDVALKYYGGWTEVIFHAARLCGEYGLDTIVIEPMIAWLMRGYQEGIFTDKGTGIPLSKVGSAEFIETLLQTISSREGFGDVLAQGTLRAAETLGKGAMELLTSDFINTRASEKGDYDPRMFIITGLFYAVEPRRPTSQLHEIGWLIAHWQRWVKGEKGAVLSSETLQNIAEKFWGGKTAADFSTYEGKALAAKKIQDRTFAKESLILCDYTWPVIWVRYSEDHVGDPALQSQLFSAITGNDINEQGLNLIGERVFNLQRAILLREGWGGRQGDRLMDFVYNQPYQGELRDRGFIIPGKGGQVMSRQGMVLEREDFEKMKDEYYQLHGWDVNSGLQTRAKLHELDLQDVARELDKRDLLR